MCTSGVRLDMLEGSMCLHLISSSKTKRKPGAKNKVEVWRGDSVGPKGAERYNPRKKVVLCRKHDQDIRWT